METVRSPLLSSSKIGFVIAVTLALSASTALEVSIISSRNFKVSGLSLTWGKTGATDIIRVFKSDADSRSRGHNIKRDLSLSFEHPKVDSPHRFPEQYGDQLSVPRSEALPSSHTTELSAGQSIPDLRGSKVKMTSVHITMRRIVLHSKADVDSPWTDGRRIPRLKR